MRNLLRLSSHLECTTAFQITSLALRVPLTRNLLVCMGYNTVAENRRCYLHLLHLSPSKHTLQKEKTCDIYTQARQLLPVEGVPKNGGCIPANAVGGGKNAAASWAPLLGKAAGMSDGAPGGRTITVCVELIACRVTPIGSMRRLQPKNSSSQYYLLQDWLILLHANTSYLCVVGWMGCSFKQKLLHGLYI